MSAYTWKDLHLLNEASNDLVQVLTSDAENLEESGLSIASIAQRFLKASETLPANASSSYIYGSEDWDNAAQKATELAGWLSLLRSEQFPAPYKTYIIQSHIVPRAAYLSHLLKSDVVVASAAKCGTKKAQQK